MAKAHRKGGKTKIKNKKKVKRQIHKSKKGKEELKMGDAETAEENFMAGEGAPVAETVGKMKKRHAAEKKALKSNIDRMRQQKSRLGKKKKAEKKHLTESMRTMIKEMNDRHEKEKEALGVAKEEGEGEGEKEEMEMEEED